MIYDDTNCILGEGPLWHPERGELFWFDILSRRLHRKGQHWDFPLMVSAAGWVDRETLLIASEVGLHVFDIGSGTHEKVADIEGDTPATRSNDGRADPQGGFWIGTMGKGAEKGAGSIWRYYRGEVRRIIPDITITNAICFAPDGTTAYFADSATQIVHRVRLDAQGWLAGAPETFIDLSAAGHTPDGAVVAADGTFWNAQWGSSRVAVYDTAGKEIAAHPFPALQTSCPAFGGPDLTTLYCTSAAAGIAQGVIAASPDQGRTFAIPTRTKGQAEHRVLL